MDKSNKYDKETGRKLSMGERYADAISEPVTDSRTVTRRTFQDIALEALQQIEACDASAICCREIARKALREISTRKATFRQQMDKALKSVGA